MTDMYVKCSLKACVENGSAQPRHIYTRKSFYRIVPKSLGHLRLSDIFKILFKGTVSVI
jgi:hypothetical protein